MTNPQPPITPPTPADMFRLAQDLPAIHNCLMLWQTGQCSWEESMMLAVSFLAKELMYTYKEYSKAIEKQKFIVIKKEE